MIAVRAWYGDNDPGAAAWLRELIAAGHITPGVVDERSILDVAPQDLAGFTRCHAFAGIAGWDLALALAGWPADRPVWTASCPCQPFSAAGKRKGQADERHLWPVLFRLLRECRPPVCFGEQVASDDGYRWLARVRADLETAGYAVGAADLPACCAGAPHIRQRLFWVARLADAGRAGLRVERQPLAGAPGGGQGEADQRQRVRHDAGDGHDFGGVGDTPDNGRDQQPRDGRVADGAGQFVGGEPADHGRVDSWSAYSIIPCRDGKLRRIPAAGAERGLFPLAAGVPGRVALLRGAGNSIVPQAAAIFIRAYLQAEADLA